MLKRFLSLFLVATVLTGCSTISGIIDDYIPSSWDANEAAVTTDIRILVKEMKCDSPQIAHESTTKILAKKEWLWTYADTRKSKDVLALIRPFNETVVGLHERSGRGEMSKAYCIAKVNLLDKQATAIAEALQSRNKR